MTLAENLARIRTERNFKQKEVADGTKMSLRSYQNYEWGLREPKASVLISLADFYNISLDELAGRDFPRKPEA